LKRVIVGQVKNNHKEGVPKTNDSQTLPMMKPGEQETKETMQKRLVRKARIKELQKIEETENNVK